MYFNWIVIVFIVAVVCLLVELWLYPRSKRLGLIDDEVAKWWPASVRFGVPLWSAVFSLIVLSTPGLPEGAATTFAVLAVGPLALYIPSMIEDVWKLVKNGHRLHRRNERG